MSQVIRISSEVYARLEKHAVGFDTPANVIEKLLNCFEGVSESSSTTNKVSIQNRDKTKYFFNNQQYGKGRLVLAVIERYVSEHPSTDINELSAIFPKDIQGSIGVINDFKFITEKYADKNHKRHFVKNNEIIQLDNGSIVVCTEWGAGNIDKFITKAKQLGYAIESTIN